MLCSASHSWIEVCRGGDLDTQWRKEEALQMIFDPSNLSSLNSEKKLNFHLL